MRKWIIVCGLVLLGILPVYGVLGQAVSIDKYETMDPPRPLVGTGEVSLKADRPARISPDYSSTVIPPNIAPLNFMVKEEGSHYLVKIYSQNGEAFEVFSKSAKIQIPQDSWRKLLEKNRGNELHFDIFVKAKNQGWSRFGTITNRIANEDIDGYLVYRRMHPTHVLSRGRIGIFQRNLGNFDEKVVLDNRGYVTNCMNCHTFCVNRPDKVLIGARTAKYGEVTVLIEREAVSKIQTKLGYAAWHPSGKLVVYSINKLPMFFHTARNEVRDTFDLDSALAYFVVDSKTIRTSPQISKKNILETWPAWSGDGRYLYFCSTPMLWTPQEKKVPPDGYDKVKYDLVRISYDLERDQWGEVETVLSSKDTGLSIAMPRVSPDGRWMMFCMCEYGQFPPWQSNSDLYIMDLKAAEETGRYEYRRLDISSDQSEAWHSWSSNSRWIVFSSKRDYWVFTRSYLSYIDESGKAYKPLVLPKKDPQYYDYCLETFNTPEFCTGPIAATRDKILRLMRGSAGVSVKMPITMATPKAGGMPERGQAWQEVQ